MDYIGRRIAKVPTELPPNWYHSLRRMYKSHRDLRGWPTLNSRGPLGHCTATSLIPAPPRAMQVHQVAFLIGQVSGRPDKCMTKMKRKSDEREQSK
jgi:hypothetical protein